MEEADRCVQRARQRIQESPFVEKLHDVIVGSIGDVLDFCCSNAQLTQLCWPAVNGADPRSSACYLSSCFLDLRDMLHNSAGVDVFLAPWMRQRLEHDFKPYKIRQDPGEFKNVYLVAPSAHAAAYAGLCFVWLPGPSMDTSLMHHEGACSGAWFEDLLSMLRILLHNAPKGSWSSRGFGFEVSIHHLGVPPADAGPDEYTPSDLGKEDGFDSSKLTRNKVGKAMATPQPGNWPNGLRQRARAGAAPNSVFPPVFVFASLPGVHKGAILIPAEIQGTDHVLANVQNVNQLAEPWEARDPSLFWRGSPGDYHSMQYRVESYLRHGNASRSCSNNCCADEKTLTKILDREMRGQLVHISRSHSYLVNAKFSRGYGWDESYPVLAKSLKELGVYDGTLVPLTSFLGSRFGAILDGYSWARNTVRTMALDLTPFYAETGLQWWYLEGLRPWEHYVPLTSDLTLEEVRKKVDWAQHEDTAARRIAETSSAFAKRWFPEKIQLVYLFAVLVRYASLFQLPIGNSSASAAVTD